MNCWVVFDAFAIDPVVGVWATREAAVAAAGREIVARGAAVADGCWEPEAPGCEAWLSEKWADVYVRVLRFPLRPALPEPLFLRAALDDEHDAG